MSDVVGRLALTIWLVGAVAKVGVLLVGLARLRWLRASSNRVTDGPWHRLCTDLARSCGLKRGVDLLFGPLPGLVATWGWLQPAVMLPASASEWSAERMRVVVLHELAQARRGDWTLQMAAEALRCVWWFNPLAWMVHARLRRESEQAADDLVLASGRSARHLRDASRRACERGSETPADVVAGTGDGASVTPGTEVVRHVESPHESASDDAPRRFWSLGVLVLVSILVAGLQSGPVTAAQDTMFRVDYVKTRTLGATVLEREEGTHTFALTGARRMDRVVDGERTTTEIVVPGTAGGGSQIVIDYSRGVVRTGPLNIATGAQASMPELPLGGRVVSVTRSMTREGASAPLRYLGAEARGPRTLHHYRAELPTGVTVDLWHYRLPKNPDVIVGDELVLAESYRSTAPDGTPELEETRIVNVAEVEFDPDAFGPGEPEEVPANPTGGFGRHVGIEEEAAELLACAEDLLAAVTPASGGSAAVRSNSSSALSRALSNRSAPAPFRGPGSRVPLRRPRSRAARPVPAAPSPRRRRSCAGRGSRQGSLH